MTPQLIEAAWTMAMSPWDIWNLGINQMAELQKKKKSEIQNEKKPDCTKTATSSPPSYSGTLGQYWSAW